MNAITGALALLGIMCVLVGFVVLSIVVNVARALPSARNAQRGDDLAADRAKGSRGPVRLGVRGTA